MASVIDICNQALSLIGVNLPIADLDEDSSEARACKRWYEQCRNALLSEGPWPVATKTATLNQISGIVPLRRQYGYTLPADCVEVVEIWNGAMVSNPESRIRFEFEQYGDARVLVTDADAVDIVYTARLVDPLQWKPLFIDALSTGLAARLSFALEKGDPAGLRSEYIYARERALSDALNEIPLEPDPLPRRIVSRG